MDTEPTDILDDIAVVASDPQHYRPAQINALLNAAHADILRLRAEVAALKADAERYRWLRERDAWMRPCYTMKRGYRSTFPNAPIEQWEEFDGWIVSTDSIHTEAHKTMDAAIDAARSAK